jgi:hypothetical protein
MPSPSLRFSCLAAVALLAMSAPASAATLEFIFKKPSDAKGWSAATQDWVVKKSGYTPIIQSKVDPVQPVALYKGQFGDVTVRTDLNVNPKNTFGGGPLVRGKVKGVRVSGYVAQASFLVGDFIVFSLYRFDKLAVDFSGDGDAELLCQKEIFNVPKDAETTVTISAEGDLIKLLYGSKLICSKRDSTYTEGRVGLINQFSESYPRYRRVTIKTP